MHKELILAMCHYFSLVIALILQCPYFHYFHRVCADTTGHCSGRRCNFAVGLHSQRNTNPCVDVGKGWCKVSVWYR